MFKRRIPGMFLAAAAASLVMMLSGQAKAQKAGFELFPSAPQLALPTDPNAAADRSAITADQQFVHPITAPYFHEDSFVSTDVRLWYLYHEFAPNSAVGGGEAQVAAAQIRVGITDQLQLVAYKDGYAWIHSGIIKKSGWNDIAAGLKYNFLQNYTTQTYAALGVGYQLPWGESKVLQNKEELRIWGSVNQGLFDKLHLGATANFFFATGETGPFGASDTFSAHFHADYAVCKFFSPVFEANFYHTWRDRHAALPIQGADVTDLGGGKSDDITTLALGFEVRPIDNVGVRAAFERNFANTKDIFDNRLTLSAVISF